MRYTITVTRRCNLNCRYCYVSRDSRQMDAATATQAVDLALSELRPGDPLDLCFFGGEPLLNLPRIQHIVAYVRGRQKETDLDLAMGITSNGTVLTPEALDFMARENISLCISLDGPEEVYYHQRGNAGGDGIFNTVVENLRRAAVALPRAKVNAVYGPATIRRLPDTVRFLAGFGVSVDLNLDITSPWTAESLADVDGIFAEVGQIYLDRFRRGEPLELHPFKDRLLAALLGGCGSEGRCKLGEGELAVDVNGDIYPCERLLGHEETIIGTVHDGIDEAKRERVVREHGQPHAACSSCPLRRYCNNSCGCTNWFLTGHFGHAHHVVCRIEKALHGAVRELLEPLGQMPAFHDHILSTAERRCHHCGKEE